MYVHRPELGIAYGSRSSLSTDQHYRVLFHNYKYRLQSQDEDLERLLALRSDDSGTALMCFERDPLRCHRLVLQNYLYARYRVPIGGDL